MKASFVENPRHSTLTLILTLTLSLSLTLTFFVNHGTVSAAVLRTWRGCFSQISHFCISGGGFLQKIPMKLCSRSKLEAIFRKNKSKSVRRTIYFCSKKSFCSSEQSVTDGIFKRTSACLSNLSRVNISK